MNMNMKKKTAQTKKGISSQRPKTAIDGPDFMVKLISRPFNLPSTTETRSTEEKIQRKRFNWVIQKDDRERYLFHGMEITISQNTDARRALDALIEVADERGVAKSAAIYSHMVLLGSTRIADEKSRNTRTSHCIGGGQGFLHHGSVGKYQERLKDILKGAIIFKTIPGEGYQLINP